MELEKIRVEALRWQPDKKAAPILDNIDAVFTSGNFYGILGPNGAGKTSLVRQLLRLNNGIFADGHSGGNIYFESMGTDYHIDTLKRVQMAGMLSFLPQSITSDIDFTVYDVVAMGREPYRRRFAPLNHEDQDKIQEAMEFTNCLHLKDKSIQYLSGGERQRVMIARTIAQDTPWIILDEPVSSLDIRQQYDVMLVLDRLRREKGKTVIAILHDLNLANSFCNQLVLMKNGHIFAIGDTQKVLTEENLKAVYEIEFAFIHGVQEHKKYIVAVGPV